MQKRPLPLHCEEDARVSFGEGRKSRTKWLPLEIPACLTAWTDAAAMSMKDIIYYSILRSTCTDNLARGTRKDAPKPKKRVSCATNKCKLTSARCEKVMLRSTHIPMRSTMCTLGQNSDTIHVYKKYKKCKRTFIADEQSQPKRHP